VCRNFALSYQRGYIFKAFIHERNWGNGMSNARCTLCMVHMSSGVRKHSILIVGIGLCEFYISLALWNIVVFQK
jgi:hypothetical protein